MQQTPLFYEKLPKFSLVFSQTQQKPLLHVKKSASFPIKPQPKEQKFANLPKIATFLQETATIPAENFENPVFWLVNDELKDSKFLEKASILQVLRCGNHKKLLKCQKKQENCGFLAKVSNLAYEIKPRKHFPSFFKKNLVFSKKNAEFARFYCAEKPRTGGILHFTKN